MRGLMEWLMDWLLSLWRRPAEFWGEHFEGDVP